MYQRTYSEVKGRRDRRYNDISDEYFLKMSRDGTFLWRQVT